MEPKPDLIDQFVQAYDALFQTLTEENRVFLQFEEKFKGERCPEPSELIPVLSSFQTVVQTFSKFVSVFEKTLYNQDKTLIITLAQLAKNKSIGGNIGSELMTSYLSINNINHPLAIISRSYLWKLTHGLMAEYAYFAPISSLPFHIGLLELPLSEEQLLKFFEIPFIKKADIQGLDNIVERAALLIAACEKTGRESDPVWWSKMIDITPKYKNFFTLDSLIEHCSDPNYPEVARRLQDLAAASYLGERQKKEIQEKLAAAGLL